MRDNFKLPNGWVETTFGAIVSAVSVNDKKLPKGGYLEVGRFPVVDQGQQFIGGYSNDETKVISEDLPVLVFGDHTRAFKYLDQPFVAGADGIKVLKPIGVNAKWLYQIAHVLEFPDKGYARHYQHLKAAQIFVPPLPEQRRIVAEIEKQFSRLEEGVSSLKRVQANLKRYRAAVLKAACEGKLVETEAMLQQKLETGNSKLEYESGEQLLKRILEERRKKWSGRGQYKEPTAPDTTNLPVLPEGWVWVELGQLAWSIKDGPHYSPKYATEGIPFISGGNIRPSGIDFANAKRITPELHAELSKRCKPEIGDLLYTKGGTTGIARVNTYTEEFNVWVHVAVLKLVDSLDRFYIQHSLNSMFCYAQAQKFTHGVGNQDLGLTRMIHICLALPPLAEQKRIAQEVERRLSVVDELESLVNANLQRALRLRQAILQQAFDGKLLSQNPEDEHALALLERIRTQQSGSESTPIKSRKVKAPRQNDGEPTMKRIQLPKEVLETALQTISNKPTASELFHTAGFKREQVYLFYDALADSPLALRRLSSSPPPDHYRHPRTSISDESPLPFRLHELWVKRFKNLTEYTVQFGSHHALDVLLGWNGTGKSNLFEVLIIIFRDLHKWQAKNKWTPETDLEGYRIRYEIDGHLVEIEWDVHSQRPEIRLARFYTRNIGNMKFEKCNREELLLPHFVFGYYSGPSNRFARLFAEPKQDHYNRLLKANSDDTETLAKLLEERRFFCAETHHAKYALLAFYDQEETAIRKFLKKHLRIEDLESVLFVLRCPKWHRNKDPEDFWGAEGLLRPVLERLRKYSIAQMVLPQSYDDGYQDSTRDHYFLLLPDKQHLQALASEYADPTSFFVALESLDFSSILHEVRIRVRINATASTQTVITFDEMSEGEQQLLMVLGLLRFTKMNQSLVLLDEPDTHLNPHWQLSYLHLLLDALVGKSSDSDSESSRQTIEDLEKCMNSQVLLSTHDPLAIAGLLKENIHLLKRHELTEECVSEMATENPRGMGFTGILTSEMFGLRSDLDEETLHLLDRHADLVGKDRLTPADEFALEKLTREVERLGFKSSSSDPYYRAFLKALGRRRHARELLLKQTSTKLDIQQLSAETDEIIAEIEREESAK